MKVQWNEGILFENPSENQRIEKSGFPTDFLFHYQKHQISSIMYLTDSVRDSA